ncbi:MAG: aminotransferase class I/II-fold pyridoxal phosphate-dependent enzyme [archaeon]|nr:aminotransferase class I/II-fold pyridoxal phosphate-dependent enzyme [archaeon]
MRYEFSEKLKKLPPYLFAEFEDMVRRKGSDVIDFGIGDSDLPVPSIIVEEMQRASTITSNQKYSSSAGEEDLREAVAEWYKKRFGVDVDPKDEVCITIGSKEGIFNIAQAFVNPKDIIIAPSPGYPVYSGAATVFNNAVCAKIPIRADDNWLLDVDDCPAGAKILYINYPNNPTGATCDLSYLRGIYDWCQENRTILCYDNAYCEMCYDGYKAPSILEAGIDAIEFGSSSKTFNMTGFRLGYAVGNRDLIAGLKRCKGQIDSGAPIFIQKAATRALGMYGSDGSMPLDIQKNMNEYAERRKVLVNGLNKIGFDVRLPKGTFYIWFDGMCKTSLECTKKMLDVGVVATPGSKFGESAEGYVRMTVTQPVTRIEDALVRLESIEF